MNALTRKMIQEARAAGLLDIHLEEGKKHTFLRATHPATGAPVRFTLSRGANATGSYRLEKKKRCDIRRAMRGEHQPSWSRPR